MGTKWTEQDKPATVTRLKPRTVYLYGADIAAQLRASLLANLDQPRQWNPDERNTR